MEQILVTKRFRRKFKKIRDRNLRSALLAALQEFQSNPWTTTKRLDAYQEFTLLEVKPPHSVPYRIYIVRDDSEHAWYVVDIEPKDRQQQAIKRLKQQIRIGIYRAFSFKNSESDTSSP